MLIHSIVELGLIGDESLVFLVNFSEILVPKLLIKHDLIETLLSDVLHVLFGKFSSEMLSCILDCQGLVTDIDTFLAQRFFRLLVKSIANSFASGWFFINPDPKVIGKSLKVMSGGKQRVSNGSNVNFFG